MGKIVALQIPRAEEVKQAYQNIIGQFAGLSGIVRRAARYCSSPILLRLLKRQQPIKPFWNAF